MKKLNGGLIFSDGSLIFVRRPRFLTGSAYKFIFSDPINHPLWSGLKQFNQTSEIAFFVSHFRDRSNNIKHVKTF